MAIMLYVLTRNLNGGQCPPSIFADYTSRLAPNALPSNLYSLPSYLRHSGFDRPSGQFGAVAESGFTEHIRDVTFDRALADIHLERDFSICQASGD